MKSGLDPELDQLIRRSFGSRARLVMDTPALGGHTIIATPLGFVRLEGTADDQRAVRKVWVQGGSPAALFSFDISRTALLQLDAGKLVVEAFARAYSALLSRVKR